MLIAINGKMGSGKDTVGSMIRYLTSECSKPNGQHYRTYEQFMEHGQGNNDFQTWYNSDWEIKKFAGKLKQIASILTGIPQGYFEDQEFKKSNLGPEWDYMTHTTYDGWVSTKMTVRELLQKLGTEGLRNGLHTNVWVNALFADYVCTSVAVGLNELDFTEEDVEPNWIITDLRFPNELSEIMKRNGKTIRVTRPGTITGGHSSETALDSYPFMYEIYNDGSIDDLLNKVKHVLTDLKII